MKHTPVIVCVCMTVVDAPSSGDACAHAKATIADMLQVAMISIDESGSRQAVFGVTDISVMSASVLGGESQT